MYILPPCCHLHTPFLSQTGVWDHVDVVCQRFLQPLRQILASTQAHCRNESRVKEEELRTATEKSVCGADNLDKPGKRDGPKMDVQLVGGEVLPEPTLKEKIEVYTNIQKEVVSMYIHFCLFIFVLSDAGC